MRWIACVLLVLCSADRPRATPADPPELADVIHKPLSTPGEFRVSGLYWDCLNGGFVVECRITPTNVQGRQQYVTAKIGQRVYDTDWTVDRVVRFDRPGAGVGLVLVMKRDKSDDWFVYQFTHCAPPPASLTTPAQGPVTEPRISLPDEPSPQVPGRR